MGKEFAQLTTEKIMDELTEVLVFDDATGALHRKETGCHSAATKRLQIQVSSHLFLPLQNGRRHG
ncbi:MAG: hypothetical protein KME31_25200 [Tolypothrix carrinoi HA7290-LM1]|nr:hypothetical protein [Tolypothrix carrinoi HA7290-LM1]